MIRISTYRIIICLMVIALTGGMLALAPSLVTPVMADEGTGTIPDNPWLTFLGGSDYDGGFGIAVDAGGNVYVTGNSYKSWGDPVRAHSNSGDPDLFPYTDVFVAKFNSDGVLLWNTFLGDSNPDHGFGIAVDAGGNVYVTGYSVGSWGSPVRAHSGSADVFVAKLSSDGGLLWNTFLGSSNNDFSYGIAVDAGGNVYVTGRSDASWGSPVRAYSGGYGDAFVAKLNNNGSLQWNTFLGGSNNDYGHGIAVDAGGNVYVTGDSDGSWGSPVRAHSESQFDKDAFVAKLNNNGSLQWNTFLGGSNNDYGHGIAVDAGGNVYVTGYSKDSWGSPVRAHSGSADAFVAKLNNNGSLQWNTFLGGSNNDFGHDIAADAGGNAYVTGGSDASWDSPVRAHSGGSDAFVAKLCSDGGLLWNTFLGSSKYDFGHNIAVNAGGNAYVTGVSDASWDTPLRPHSGGSDAFVVKLNSKGELESTGPKINLTISKSGTGSGSVTSNPAGINCGSTCSATFPKDTTINLTATPAEGSVFVGWAGDCTGAGTNPECIVTMDASKNVTARFGSTTPTSGIELLRGWNFISMPVEPSHTSITTILKDISSSVRIVWGYDNQNKTWKRFRPGGENNDLGDMVMNKGYWIYMNTPETLIIEGQPSDPQAVTLYKGWNLTGYSGQDNKDVSQALENVAGRWTLIWNWDNGGWYARHESDLELSVAPLGALNLKKAYWILMKEAGEWQQ